MRGIGQYHLKFRVVSTSLGCFTLHKNGGVGFMKTDIVNDESLLQNRKDIYTCTFLNKEHNIEMEYEEIFKENVKNQLRVSKIFFQ